MKDQKQSEPSDQIEPKPEEKKLEEKKSEEKSEENNLTG